MAIAYYSDESLIDVCDTIHPNTGNIGYVALLKPDLTVSMGFSVDTGTNLFTSVSAHNLTTGSRIRKSSSGGGLPAPLVSATDYYVVVVSPTTYRVATTKANALNVSPVTIDITTAGSGTLTFNEQVLNRNDALAVLLAKEITHPAWTARAPINAVGASTISGTDAVKAPISIPIANTDPATLSYKHILLLYGASVTSTIGSSVGVNRLQLATEVSTQTIANGETKTPIIQLKQLLS